MRAASPAAIVTHGTGVPGVPGEASGTPGDDVPVDADALLRTAADRLETLAARTTPGEWRPAGLLATRPEVVAHRPDGGTQHVAEARADSAAWITALSPAVAEPLAALLRTLAAGEPPAEALELARALLHRLP